MRRIFFTILSLIVIFQSTGFFIAFQFEQFKVKKEVRRLIRSTIPDNELTLFIFHQSEIGVNSMDLKWIHSREFEFKGQMFDVVRKTFRGDSVEMFCYRDLGEEALFQKYAGNLKTDNEPKTISLKIIVNPIAFVFNTFHFSYPSNYIFTRWKEYKENILNGFYIPSYLPPNFV